MRAQNIIFHPANNEEMKALKAIGKALKLQFEITDEKKPYNPEFVAKIKESKKQIQEGNFKIIKTDDLWK